MKTLRDVIVILAGVGLLLALITGTTVSDVQKSLVALLPPADTPEPVPGSGQADTEVEQTDSAGADAADPAGADAADPAGSDAADPAGSDPSTPPTPTPTPTPAATILPTAISIYGISSGPCAKSVTYEPVNIVVAEALGQPIEPILLYPPVHPAADQRNFGIPFCPKGEATPGAAAFLQVTPEPAKCADAYYGTPAAGGDLASSMKCYQVSVRDDAKLQPGEYQSTLYVHPRTGFPATPANVSVKVRLNIWWPIAAVAAGVLVTEILVRWRKRWRYSLDWKRRRNLWFDLLSERIDWITGLKEEDKAKREALRQAKIRLRHERKALNDWLAKGRKGEVKVGQVPDSLDAARDLVHPLRQAVEDTVAYQDAGGKITAAYQKFDQKLGYLAEKCLGLGDEVTKQAKKDLVDASTEVHTKLYPTLAKIATDADYKALKKKWTAGTPPAAAEELKAAWNVIKDCIEQKPKALKDDFDAIKKHVDKLKPAPDPATATLAGHVDELASHLAEFKNQIVDAAVKQQEEIKNVKDTTGVKVPTEKVLKLLADLETHRSAAAQKVTRAEQPLKDHGTNVGTSVGALEAELAGIDDLIDNLKAADLSDHAILEIMLKPIRESLAKADEEMSQPQTEANMTAIWQRLPYDYRRGKRLVNVGRRLVSLYQRRGATYPDVKRHAVRGYQYLLSGEPLRAEIELERAEHILLTKPLAKAATKDGILARITKAWPTLSFRTLGCILAFALPALVLVLVIALSWLILLLYRAAETGWLLALPDARSPILIVVIVAISSALLAVVIYLLIKMLRFVKKIRWGVAALGELIENLVSGFAHIAMLGISQLLTIVVAVALVLVAHQLLDTADTWGSPADFVLAFTWGVFANRLAQPVESMMEKVAAALKPAPETTDESSEQGGEEEQKTS